MKFATVSVFVTLITAGLALPCAAVAIEPAPAVADEATPYWPAAKREAAPDADKPEARRPMWRLRDETDDPEPVAKPVARHKPSAKPAPKATPRKATARKAVAPKRNTQTHAAPAKKSVAPSRPQPQSVKPAAKVPAKASASAAADQIIVADLTRTCGAKDGHACFMLGRMYATGTITGKNNATALKSYKRSCDLGNASGCHALAGMHEKGTGTPVNAAEAGRYYKLACKSGNAPACKSTRKPQAWFGLGDLFAPKAPAP